MSHAIEVADENETTEARQELVEAILKPGEQVILAQSAEAVGTEPEPKPEPRTTPGRHPRTAGQKLRMLE